MKKRMILFSLLVGAISLAIVPQLAADHHEKGEAQKGEMQMTPEQQAEMEKWMQLGSPGEPHGEMAMFAGTWDVEGTSWMAPDAEPMKSTGKAVHKMILGGRYMVQEYKSKVMGMDYEGHGLMAYDNYAGKYFSLWIDNMSTMVMTMTGTADGTGKTVTLTGTMPNVMTGEEETLRSVQRMVDENTVQYVMYKTGPDGKEFKHMELTYTKTGDSAAKAGY